jgi:hypothetical protein
MQVFPVTSPEFLTDADGRPYSGTLYALNENARAVEFAGVGLAFGDYPKDRASYVISPSGGWYSYYLYVPVGRP